MEAENEANIDEIHAAIMAHIPESDDWSERDRREASSFINAVVVSLLGLETHPHEVKVNLVGFENGYGGRFRLSAESYVKGERLRKLDFDMS